MRQDQDFDFRIGRGYNRGRGVRGLAALAIVQLPRIALLGAGLVPASPTLQWVWQLAQGYADRRRALALTVSKLR
jgi:hypothetical protein